jgi:serine/threonine protein kinase
VGSPTWGFEVLRRATHGFAEDNKIGEGSFGVVYRADLEDGRTVAVKTMDALLYQQLTADERRSVAQKFMREVGVLQRIRHVNVITYLGHCMGMEEYRLAIVLEHVPETLYHRLFSRAHGSVPLTAIQRCVCQTVLTDTRDRTRHLPIGLGHTPRSTSDLISFT